MANRGYSKKIKAQIESADSTSLGVELGRLCMLHGYSIREVAEVFEVTRPTVYNWMTNKYAPTKHLVSKMQALVNKLRSKPIPDLIDENE